MYNYLLDFIPAIFIGILCHTLVTVLMRQREVFGWWPGFIRRLTNHNVTDGPPVWWKYAIHKVLFECGKCMSGWACILFLLTNDFIGIWDTIFFIGLGIFTANYLESTI